MLNPHNEKACVRYYYLAARNGNGAEIIEVLNSRSTFIVVPVWEEDIILEPFYTRSITPKEEQACKGVETWKLFSEWEKLYIDHRKYEIEGQELAALEDYRNKVTSSESILA